MNKSPQVLFDREARSMAYFEKQLQDVEERGIKSITFLIASEYLQNQDTIDPFLKNMTVPVSGGVFGEVIYDGQYFTDGMIAVLWFHETRVSTFLDASNLSSVLYQQQDSILEGTDHKTSLVFSNTKMRAAEAALDTLYYRNGQSSQYAGTGTGILSDLDGSSIVTNDGLVADAVQITSFPYKQKNHVGHGWAVLSGPHLVTESEQNRVKTLDYQAIKPYYESLIKNSVGDEANDLTFQQMIEIYPIGIQPYDEDMIVRAIQSSDDEDMHFFGDIPEFSSVYILSGKQENLLNYVRNKADSFKTIASEKPDLSIVFSCSGRRAHMAEKSDEELAILTNSMGNSRQIIGVRSIGEIASNSTGLACFHSMSLVVANLWI
ncbi:FIST C-terminal domain-containing protein [Leucothrix arctica]|uniref:FIST C-domain domain-containing protein n=1 Tax=Leucothrix arctica TaxID=1481894 RepID=A0A317CB34_9GAMM|nr:FIST C-terminal domain-containing protein [Leucothrix arctica]PWQ95351.1 hypothetical protein DKT75_13515 [Leucothrix arctica]